MDDNNPYKHVPFEEVLRNKENYAKLFANGDRSLERLLMHCFNNNISTYMCGTDYDEEGATFFALYVPYDNNKLIYSIVNSVSDLNGVVIRLQKDHDKSNALMVDIRSYYCDNLFDCLYNGVSNMDNVKSISIDIIKIIDTLEKFNNSLYDFYVQITNVDDCHKLYCAGADYVHDGKKHLYTLLEDFYSKQLDEIPQHFSDQILEEKAKIIDSMTLNIGKEK